MKQSKTVKTIKNALIFLSTTIFCMAAALLPLPAMARAEELLSGEEQGAEITEPNYYLCFSTQNYAVRPANLMTKTESGEYVLEDVSLSSDADFYVTDNAGSRYYAANDKPMSVAESGTYAYTIKFSPDLVYAEEEGGWAKTDCRITYAFYLPASYSLTVNGEEQALTYNPYHTSYDLYYLYASLEAGQTVVYTYEKDGSEEEGSVTVTETLTANVAGEYRILFTPGETRGGNDYLFNENGVYGTGEKYTMHIYMEYAPRYYVVFNEEFSAEADATVGEKAAYRLTRYEKNTTAEEYRSNEFFLAEADHTLKYTVYEEELNGNFTLLDADNDGDDIDLNETKVTDAGWYTFGFTVSGARYQTAVNEESHSFGCWYLASDRNGYGYNAAGEIDLTEDDRLTKVETDDEDYNEDYEQYIAYITVTERMLKQGNLKFYVTDGEDKYKNVGEYIELNTAGVYKFLFSEEHIYGRGRHYRYILQDETIEKEKVEIGTAEEFNAFAQKCSQSATYSANKIVYLTADIDFKGVEIQPIGYFGGIFYGGYHTLNNITLTDGGDTTGVFKVVREGGKIQDITANVTIENREGEYVGFVAKNYGTLENVTVGGTVIGKRYVGGVTAYNGRSAADDNSVTADSQTAYVKGQCLRCVNNAAVTGEANVGGIAGYNGGELLSCQNNGDIFCYAFKSGDSLFNIGGVAGYSVGRIAEGQNTGKVDGDGLYTGGVAGLCTGEIYLSANSGNVRGKKYVGGVVGYYGTIGENSNDLRNYFGGVDYSSWLENYFSDDGEDFTAEDGESHALDYLFNQGNVTAISDAGGILGYTQTAIQVKNCLSAGRVEVTAGDDAGGIAGSAVGAEIVGCMSSGVVKAAGLSAGQNVGGIVGSGSSVTASASDCYLVGSDYIGGIAGRITTRLTQCWSDVLIRADEGSEHIGGIAGYIEGADGKSSFGDGVRYNYYIGDAGGIAGAEYADGDHAAQRVTSEELSFDGMISPVLYGFSDEYWLGGEGKTYPVPRYLDEIEDASDYGDDQAFLAIAERQIDYFRAAAQKHAAIGVTVVVMECNDGDPYDEGKIDADHFTEIGVYRLYDGETLPEITLVYAKEREGKWVYEGEEAHYFATVSLPQGFGGGMVYVTYRKTVTTLSSSDGKVLAEGLFDAETSLEVVPLGNYYTLKFTLNGEEVTYPQATVKVYAGKEIEKSAVYTVNGGKESMAESNSVGEYLRFDWTDGMYFRTGEKPTKELPAWAWGIIGGGIGMAALVVVYFVVRAVRKGKKADR